MTLDDLITWNSSQARRLEDEAHEMEITGHPVASTVGMLRGRAEIHRETSTHLTRHRDNLRAAHASVKRQSLYIADL